MSLDPAGALPYLCPNLKFFRNSHNSLDNNSENTGIIAMTWSCPTILVIHYAE